MREEDLVHLAVFNVAAYVGMAMISFYRIMRDPQPDRVANRSGALTAHLARRATGKRPRRTTNVRVRIIVNILPLIISESGDPPRNDDDLLPQFAGTLFA